MCRCKTLGLFHCLGGFNDQGLAKPLGKKLLTVHMHSRGQTLGPQFSEDELFPHGIVKATLPLRGTDARRLVLSKGSPASLEKKREKIPLRISAISEILSFSLVSNSFVPNSPTSNCFSCQIVA